MNSFNVVLDIMIKTIELFEIEVKKHKPDILTHIIAFREFLKNIKE